MSSFENQPPPSINLVTQGTQSINLNAQVNPGMKLGVPEVVIQDPFALTLEERSGYPAGTLLERLNDLQDRKVEDDGGAVDFLMYYQLARG